MSAWLTWIELAGTAGGLVALLLAAIQFRQWIVDSIPRLSYVITRVGIFPNARGEGGRLVRGVAVNFTIRNRTSRDATMECSLAIPGARAPDVCSWTMLQNTRLVNTRFSREIDMASFVIPSRETYSYAIFGDLLPQTPAPKVLELRIHDDRFGSRGWSITMELPVGEFPRLSRDMSG